jgi:hypothetical protein
MCVRIEHEVPSGPLAPQLVRDFVAAQLDAAFGSPSPVVAEDLRLVASELATNAIRAGSTNVGVVLELHRASVKIEISDDAAGQPVMALADPAADTGRGLVIVDDIATEWGAEPRPGGRKSVWAILSVPPHVTHALGCAHVVEAASGGSSS